METRQIGGTVEKRGGSRGIGGDALQFNKRSKPIGGRNGFVETIAPSFADRAKAAMYQGIIARYAHQDQYLLGAVDNRTLEVSANGNGVQYRCEVPEYLDWVYRMVERGDLRSSSFSFTDAEDEWSYENGRPLRTLLGGNLFEVAPTPIGAYSDANVGLRSALQSLANFKHAPYEDVARMYESDSLSKMFVDTRQRTLTGVEARARLESLRPRTGRQAVIATLEMRRSTPKQTPRQVLTEALRKPPYETAESIGVHDYGR